MVRHIRLAKATTTDNQLDFSIYDFIARNAIIYFACNIHKTATSKHIAFLIPRHLKRLPDPVRLRYIFHNFYHQNLLKICLITYGTQHTLISTKS